MKDQLKGPSSIEGFARTLKKGCRYIEREFTHYCGSLTLVNCNTVVSVTLFSVLADIFVSSYADFKQL